MVRHVPVGPEDHYAMDVDGCPVLDRDQYATNGEVTWFHDVRHERNRFREGKRFHTQAALRELLEKDDEGARDRLRRMPHDDPRLRPPSPSWPRRHPPQPFAS